MGIVHDLIEENFFSVAGTMQGWGAKEAAEMVGKGQPLTWATNNGILVVYDENGLPWIRSRKFFTHNGEERFAEHLGLKRGAHVPHSNDGGSFKQRVWEALNIEI